MENYLSVAAANATTINALAHPLSDDDYHPSPVSGDCTTNKINYWIYLCQVRFEHRHPPQFNYSTMDDPPSAAATSYAFDIDALANALSKYDHCRSHGSSLLVWWVLIFIQDHVIFHLPIRTCS